MKLIIAEKPDVCKQLKNAIEPGSTWTVVKKTSKYAVGYYEGRNYIFAAAQGHLFELQSPGEINPQYERWILDDLPMILPNKIPLKPNRADTAYFKTLEKLIKRNDVEEIIVATDPDKEGQNIYEKIKLMVKNFPVSTVETRLWITEWTAEGLRDALDNRKQNSAYDGLRIAAECREEADAIIGWNDSRVGTLVFGGKGNLISFGRVQTPTNFFVADLERKIREFIPESYSVLSLAVDSDETGKQGIFKYVLKDGKLDKAQADAIYDAVTKIKETSVLVSRKNTTVGCLPLFNTVEVQKEMNKLYGYTAEETSNCLQSLYLNGLTTYPRTEAKKIAKANAKGAFNALLCLSKTSAGNSYMNDAISNSYSMNDSCLTTDNLAHEAITPAFGSVSDSDIKGLNVKERNVYNAIVKRFVQAFYPKCEIEEITATTSVLANGEKETFEAKGKVVNKAGWTAVVGIDKNVSIPNYTNGSIYDIFEVIKEEKQTTPPSRYTEAGLLDAMDNAGRFVSDKSQAKVLKECEGIGTGATRDAIIKCLKDRNYIELQKGKTIYPTTKSMELFDVLPDCPLTSPAMTAELEQDLTLVEQGKMTKAEFMKKVYEQVELFVSAVKSCTRKEVGKNSSTVAKSATQPKSTVKRFAECPNCGKEMIENDKSFTCPGFRDGCRTTIWKNALEKLGKPKITKTEARKLITGNTITVELVSKAGNPYKAKVSYDKNTNKVSVSWR